MRTRLAAGSVAAAALLTLFGSNVAGADEAPHAQTKSDPTPVRDAQGRVTDTTGRMNDPVARTNGHMGRINHRTGRINAHTGRINDHVGRTHAKTGRTNDRSDRPEWMNDSPVRMAACALGTVVGSLTDGNDCVRDRMGYDFGNHVR